eukprot:11232895-Alexandrium_andersonii.AAC.1
MGYDAGGSSSSAKGRKKAGSAASTQGSTRTWGSAATRSGNLPDATPRSRRTTSGDHQRSTGKARRPDRGGG